jgi:hypothetical protein
MAILGEIVAIGADISRAVASATRMGSRLLLGSAYPGGGDVGHSLRNCKGRWCAGMLLTRTLACHPRSFDLSV